MSDDLVSTAELVWENEGGRLRPASPDGPGEGSDDDAAVREPGLHDQRNHGPPLPELVEQQRTS
ncbi:hypothetical protein ACVGVM_29860 (plasmid) [Pseudonocardia bannensis]|uniref:Uncharacterized protein n=1 Tax=Pseudonocardia bannensis TaxID=630973 RepID=A0A848DRF9_9PSEU|nr:hypothetical protein [Pseudonocardia bannensis]NMH94971.1 hypothetical protein [Pseudonocardia bannensis]